MPPPPPHPSPFPYTTLFRSLAVGTELSDRSFRSPAEIRKRLGVPVLGHVPRIHTDAPPTRPSATGLDPSLVEFLRPSSSEAEARSEEHTSELQSLRQLVCRL